MAMRRNRQHEFGRCNRIDETIMGRVARQTIRIAKVRESQRRVSLEVMLVLLPPALDRVTAIQPRGCHYPLRTLVILPETVVSHYRSSTGLSVPVLK